jgi:hypothetical protein
MYGITVSVVPVHVTANTVVWYIKRVAPGRNWMGWAKGDGTFTPGINPTVEANGCEMFRTAQYAVEFAQEQGWNVASIIDR